MNYAVVRIHGYGTRQEDGGRLGREAGQSQVVKTKGKARETTAMISRCVKARTRQRQNGQRPAEGEGREDKARKTSDPAHHPTDTLLPLVFPTHSVGGPGGQMDGVDTKPGQAGTGPRPATNETTWSEFHHCLPSSASMLLLALVLAPVLLPRRVEREQEDAEKKENARLKEEDARLKEESARLKKGSTAAAKGKPKTSDAGLGGESSLGPEGTRGLTRQGEYELISLTFSFLLLQGLMGQGLSHYAKSRDYEYNHTAQSGASRRKTPRTRGRDGDSRGTVRRGGKTITSDLTTKAKVSLINLSLLILTHLEQQAAYGSTANTMRSSAATVRLQTRVVLRGSGRPGQQERSVATGSSKFTPLGRGGKTTICGASDTVQRLPQGHQAMYSGGAIQSGR
ncbi:hypothetical protein CF327_g2700 [Tilletia walkeri]|nr:hypothetical protein CF327_g2700 [Tilletia walkeri]